MEFVWFSLETCQSSPYYGYSWLNCRSVSWADLTFNIMQRYGHMQRLDIRDSDLYDIKPATFRRYNNLGWLSMTGNNITILEAGSFSGLTNLNYLNLSSNNIQTIPKGLFSGMYKLEILDLSNNIIDGVDNTSLAGTDNLKSLYLHKNKLVDMPLIGNHCKSLRTLDLSNNNIEELTSLENCNLESLDLANNNLSAFAADRLSSSIIYLNISGNAITSISGEDFVSLPALKELSLSRNPLFEVGDFPVNLFQNIQHLRVVNLSATGIGKINVGSFSGLQELNILDISSNDLTFLPNGLFHDLKSLLQLDISNNHLSYFQYDGFSNLNEINLNKNLWNCDSLAVIINKLKHTNIRRGNSFNTTNLFGIHCYEDSITANSYNSSELSLEKEYLSQIIKTQVDMRSTFTELKNFLSLTESRRIDTSKRNGNSDLDSDIKNLLNTSTLTLKTYQKLLERKELNMGDSFEKLTEALQLLKNETSIIATIEKENNDNLKQIIELQQSFVNFAQRNDSNIYWQKFEEVHSDLRRILTDIQTSVISKVENQKSTASFTAIQPNAIEAYKPLSTNGGDVVALYCIFVVLLVILVVILFTLYRRYKGVNRTYDEANSLRSLGV